MLTGVMPEVPAGSATVRATVTSTADVAVVTGVPELGESAGVGDGTSIGTAEGSTGGTTDGAAEGTTDAGGGTTDGAGGDTTDGAVGATADGGTDDGAGASIVRRCRLGPDMSCLG